MSIAGRFEQARRTIEAREQELGRTLSAGERRDLLLDSTGWPRADIEEIARSIP